MTVSTIPSIEPPNLSYTINDPAIRTDVTGMFVDSCTADCSHCFRYEFEFVNPTSLPPSDPSAITFACETVTVSSTDNNSAGIYEVRIFAADVTNGLSL